MIDGNGLTYQLLDKKNEQHTFDRLHTASIIFNLWTENITREIQLVHHAH